MATRYYLPTTAADVTPADGATWDVTGSGSPTLLADAKTNTALADFTVTFNIVAWPFALCLVRAVSGPLAAQTISGTVKMQLECLESSTGANFEDGLELYVVSNDGSSVVGTLLAQGTYGPGTEMNTSRRNKTFANGDALSSLAVSDGDRIVAAFGARTSGGIAGTRTMTGRMGDATATSDAAENETTTADRCGWIEFSADIAAYVPNPPVLSSGAMSATFAASLGGTLIPLSKVTIRAGTDQAPQQTATTYPAEATATVIHEPATATMATNPECRATTE